MNLVEVWFSLLERQAIHRGTFGPVKDLNAKIRRHLTTAPTRPHRTGTPLFSAMSRSSDSACRTSPTMMRDGRMRSASLTSRRSGYLPRSLEAGLPAVDARDVAQGIFSSKTSSHVITRSRDGMDAARQLSRVVLPACVPPATRMLRPATTAGVERRGRVVHSVEMLLARAAVTVRYGPRRPAVPRPLVIFLIYKDRSPFVRRHALESLNFQLTLLLEWLPTGSTPPNAT